MLDLPNDFDLVLYFNCICLFLISFLMMSFDSGVLSINCLQKTIPFSPESNINYSIPVIQFNYTQDNSNLNLEFQKRLLRQNKIIPYINYFLYFIILPSVNIIYGLFCLLTGKLYPFYKKCSVKI